MSKENNKTHVETQEAINKIIILDKYLSAIPFSNTEKREFIIKKIFELEEEYGLNMELIKREIVHAYNINVNIDESNKIIKQINRALKINRIQSK